MVLEWKRQWASLPEQEIPIPRARELAPDAPSDLDGLCAALLRTNAAKRPGEEDVLAVLGAAEEGVSRIDLALSGDPAEPAMIAQLVAGESGEILGMGTYKEEPKEGRGQVMYLRVRSDDARKVADMLTDKNYTVVAIHQ